MKKKRMIFFMCLICCVCMLTSVLPVSAADADGFADVYYRLQDEAGLLSEDEWLYLQGLLDEVSVRQRLDVTIATTDTLGGLSVSAYADDWYDRCEYGYGVNRDGILLLLSMEERDWYISTCGFGIQAFTDAGIDYIVEQMIDDLSDGNYAQAFETYIEYCDAFVTQARIGEPYDRGNLPKEPLSPIWLGISLLLGLVVAGCVVAVMWRQLKSVRPQAAANSYIRSGSMHLRERSDLFLYHTVTRTPRPKDPPSEGGSSTHTSSSGTTHGGHGGKF